ncbi:MAG: hypothetical protein ABGY41_23430, partial [Candidatus Poribacteria bacterium]
EIFGGVGNVGNSLNTIEDFSNYGSASGFARASIQIGIALSPNPNAPLLFDLPDLDGPQLPSEWRDHCLLDFSTVGARHEELSLLSAIVVGVADGDKRMNFLSNNDMLTAFGQAGVKAAHVPTPGTHGGDRPRRFILLANLVTRVMNTGFPDPTTTTPEVWARIKLEDAP